MKSRTASPPRWRPTGWNAAALWGGGVSGCSSIGCGDFVAAKMGDEYHQKIWPQCDKGFAMKMTKCDAGGSSEGFLAIAAKSDLEWLSVARVCQR